MSNAIPATSDGRDDGAAEAAAHSRIATAVMLYLVVWLPAWVAASYSWRFGDYYDYGWFVPAAALLLVCRRAAMLASPENSLPRERSMRGWWIAFGLALPCWIVFRVLVFADPSWRLPMWLAGLLAVGLGHFVLALRLGRTASTSFFWISLLLLSALPWPSVLEGQIIHTLTDGVTRTTVEVFQLLGRPVVRLGDQLMLNGTVVEVSDGCSGVRSFQSFFMATWFFAEWQKMRVGPALVLLVLAMCIAFVVNSARSYALAVIRFDHGEAAFDRAHDSLGLLAFAISAVGFYFLSGALAAPARRRVVRSVPSPNSFSS